MSDDPVLAALAEIPPDDEPVTDEHRMAIERGRRDYLAGRYVARESVGAYLRRRYGMTADEMRRYWGR